MWEYKWGEGSELEVHGPFGSDVMRDWKDGVCFVCLLQWFAIGLTNFYYYSGCNRIDEFYYYYSSCNRVEEFIFITLVAVGLAYVLLFY